MKVDLKVEVINILTGLAVQLPVESDKPLKEGEEQKTKPLMLHNVVSTALTADDPRSEEKASLRVSRWKLAKKIIESGDDYEVNLTSEDITLIKEWVNKTYSTLVVGWVDDYLENGVIDGKSS